MTAPVMVEHRYTPRGACLEAFHDRSSEVLLSGPAGTGKSRAALEKLHAVMLHNPGARGLIVRKTLASLGSTALVTWREHVAVEAIAHGVMTFYGGSSEEPPQYRYRNGSRVMIGGMDKPTRVMSSEYDMIYVQEAIELSKTDWEALTTRLRNGRVSFQQLIADTNPDTETHWLNVRSSNGPCRMLESRHTDNPVLYDEHGVVTERGAAYLGRLDALTGIRRLRLRDGLWVSAEGIIYDGYNPAVHLVDRFPIPDEWPRWWAVDFGYVHPFAATWWAEDPDGRLHLYRELLMTGRLVEDHAKTMLAAVTGPVRGERGTGDDVIGALRAGRRKWIEPRPRAILCDHDAEDRATLERHLGMSTQPARKTVSDGLQAVAARFKLAGDGRPRLFLMRDSLVERDRVLADAERPTCLAEEIPGYVWDTGAGKKPKEAPLKVDDDAADTMRYTVAQLDLAARPRIRSM